MRWISHKVLTASIVMMITGNPFYAIYSIPGAVFPDWIEGRPPDGADYWGWRQRHRGLSHWFVPYLVGFCGIYYLKQKGFAFWGYPFLGDAGLFVMIGALMHILEDAVCGKVPVFSLKKRYGVKLFPVGSFIEYMFCAGVIAAVYYFKYCS